jgi:phosphoribosylanthranilate isomerase
MTVVKICGITNLDDARCATVAGADLLGFIFYAVSPRYITPRDAGHIASALHAEFAAQRPRLVGVFVDTPVDAIRRAMHEAHLDLVQLHGAESPSTVTDLHPAAFKALRPRSLPEAQAALQTYAGVWTTNKKDALIPHLLIDAYHPQQKGGTGARTDTAIAHWLAARCRMMLAGGLSPHNVASAIADIHPWGVDVSSGVERATGRKDHDQIHAFVRAVRTAEVHEALEPAARQGA